jgi:UPF0271 protein
MAPWIDLNADLGEDPEAVRDGRDEALLSMVTSANIACGGHAGDEATMEATVAAAMRHGVALGAHPSYPDRARFGRAVLPMTPEEIEDVVFSQIFDLGEIVGRLGGALVHVKPHGALYGACARDPGVARAFAGGVARWCTSLRIVGQAGSPALRVWAEAGFATTGEGFADRRYEPDGSLRDRSFADALITDPREAALQALAIAEGRGVVAVDRSAVAVPARSICIHADTPGAVAIARAVHFRLTDAGFLVRPAGTAPVPG